MNDGGGDGDTLTSDFEGTRNGYELARMCDYAVIMLVEYEVLSLANDCKTFIQLELDVRVYA